MGSTYIRLVINAFFVAGVYGLLLPWMVSASDDFLVIGGIIIGVLIAPAVLYYANKTYVTNLMEKLK